MYRMDHDPELPLGIENHDPEVPLEIEITDDLYPYERIIYFYYTFTVSFYTGITGHEGKERRGAFEMEYWYNRL